MSSAPASAYPEPDNGGIHYGALDGTPNGGGRDGIERTST
jgi:hypothetical protein